MEEWPLVVERLGRAKPEQGSGKGWMGKQGREGADGTLGSGGLEKGKSFEM